MPYHGDLIGDDAVHPIAFRQAVDPGPVGSGKCWLDDSIAADIKLKVRNAADDGWDVLWGTLKQFSIQIGHGTAAVGLGPRASWRMHHAGIWVGHRLVAPFDASCSIVLDLWKDTYANFPPTSADSICSGARPTITSGVKAEDLVLTGWTKTFARDDEFILNVVSNTGCTGARLSLLYYRT